MLLGMVDIDGVLPTLINFLLIGCLVLWSAYDTTTGVRAMIVRVQLVFLAGLLMQNGIALSAKFLFVSCLVLWSAYDTTTGIRAMITRVQLIFIASLLMLNGLDLSAKFHIGVLLTLHGVLHIFNYFDRPRQPYPLYRPLYRRDGAP